MGKTVDAVVAHASLTKKADHARLQTFFSWLCLSRDVPLCMSSSWVREQRRIEMSKVEYFGVSWKWPVDR